LEDKIELFKVKNKEEFSIWDVIDGTFPHSDTVKVKKEKGKKIPNINYKTWKKTNIFAFLSIVKHCEPYI
jgi:hypothetical protein